MRPSKYYETIEQAAGLKTDKECVLLSARPEDRARIAANIKYHLKPPEGYVFATKYIRPHVYVFLRKLDASRA